MKPADAAALKAAFRGRTRAQLKRMFALVRTHSDRDLLALMAPPRKRAPKRRPDPLVAELNTTLKPIIGPAREKAELLVDHLSRKHRRKLNFDAKGLADAVRRLRNSFTDAQIAAGAKSLVRNLAKLYGDRDTVV